MTVLQMTPSPVQSPLISDLSPIGSSSFSSIQQNYLDQSMPTPTAVLFRDSTPTKRRRKRSNRRARLSDSLHLEDSSFDARPPLAITRRRSGYRKYRGSPSTSDTSPETSTSGRMDGNFSRQPSPQRPYSPKDASFKVNYHWFIQITFACMIIISAAGIVFLTSSVVSMEHYDPVRPEMHMTEAGLRGKMVSGHWDRPFPAPLKQKSKSKDKKHGSSNEKKNKNKKKPDKKKEKTLAAAASKKEKHGSSHEKKTHSFPRVAMPPPLHKSEQKFETQDLALYSKVTTNKRRVVALDPSMPLPHHRTLKLYPADFTDNTQLYPILDSEDERLKLMEIREPYENEECVPMQEWQTTFHPSCNEMHELPLADLGVDDDMDFLLFGTKGYWRNAWRVDFQEEANPIVLKTLKFEHNFEDAHFEHDRIDAVAMERLTSSKHVINIFGFCGHSVMTEFADNPSIGKLVEKAKKKPLQLLRIARDISKGLAEIHGIDGDNNSTFVHLDINPANVVGVGGTLKLNDFNIGIIRQWNTTSDEPCGFPAQYPNPQWRSPEEAREQNDLTEKVDVFSMGHIFFRLICGAEPWNKLEPNGRPSKEEIAEKVKNGVLPHIPESVMESEDPEVVAIREAMLKCYSFHPEDRPSARSISRSLDKILQKLKKETISVM